MATGPDKGDSTLTAEDAFATLGDATRMGIIRRLGEDEPQSFTQLRKAVGVEDSGRFNYHLGELTGHFVRKTGDEYALREPGSRVVQAVLSGAVTDDRILETTRLDASCPYCGNPIDIMFREERLVISCAHCPGSFSGTETDARFLDGHPGGTVAVLKFPPAGVASRTDLEVLEAALAWSLDQTHAFASGLCPRCAAVVEQRVTVCENHDAAPGLCSECNIRYGVLMDYHCTNCTHVEVNFPVGLHLLLTSPDLQAFVGARGTDPLDPSWESHAEISAFTEDITDTDPLQARFGYTFKGDVLEITVNEELSIVDISESDSV